VKYDSHGDIEKLVLLDIVVVNYLINREKQGLKKIT